MKKSLSMFIELKENYDLCDTWRVRNTKCKRFTFAQKHSSGFIQRRLDYIFISNTLQESVIITEILTPISTDHSPVLISLSEEKGCFRDKGIWNSYDQDYIIEINKMIHTFCTANKCLSNSQLK